MANRHILEQIDEYLQGALDPTARAAAESHLAACRNCREALEDAREAIAMMGWLPMPEPPPRPSPEFYYRVQASIQKAQSVSWLSQWMAGLQPRLAIPMLMVGMLLLAWIVSLPRQGAARNPDGWEEVEYPSADFAQMSYFDDQDEARHDRMINNLFDAAEAR